MNAFTFTNGATGHEADEAIDLLYSWVAPQAPASSPLPEAAFSLTLKGTLNGVEALLTARGMSAEEFKRHIESIKGLLDPAPTPASSQGQPQGEGDTPLCPTHGELKRSTKGKGWYCPAKNADGSWCNCKGK